MSDSVIAVDSGSEDEVVVTAERSILPQRAVLVPVRAARSSAASDEVQMVDVRPLSQEQQQSFQQRQRERDFDSAQRWAALMQQSIVPGQGPLVSYPVPASIPNRRPFAGARLPPTALLLAEEYARRRELAARRHHRVLYPGLGRRWNLDPLLSHTTLQQLQQALEDYNSSDDPDFQEGLVSPPLRPLPRPTTTTIHQRHPHRLARVVDGELRRAFMELDDMGMTASGYPLAALLRFPTFLDFHGRESGGDTVPPLVFRYIEEQEDEANAARVNVKKKIGGEVRRSKEQQFLNPPAGYTTSLDESTTPVCTLCGVVLGEGIPSASEHAVGTVEELQQRFGAPAPYQALSEVTDTARDLSRRVFFAKCGHCYCGRCFKNIGNWKARRDYERESRAAQRAAKRRKTTAGEPPPAPLRDWDVSHVEDLAVSHPSVCPVPGCSTKLRNKLVFLELFY